ncbi:MAG: hypothetical protein O3A31_11985, partial [Planctomycetota bacterium]|nr:hypothetical protein [Planctomycetota bacterium]
MDSQLASTNLGAAIGEDGREVVVFADHPYRADRRSAGIRLVRFSREFGRNRFTRSRDTMRSPAVTGKRRAGRSSPIRLEPPRIPGR